MKKQSKEPLLLNCNNYWKTRKDNSTLKMVNFESSIYFPFVRLLVKNTNKGWNKKMTWKFFSFFGRFFCSIKSAFLSFWGPFWEQKVTHFSGKVYNKLSWWDSLLCFLYKKRCKLYNKLSYLYNKLCYLYKKLCYLYK